MQSSDITLVIAYMQQSDIGYTPTTNTILALYVSSAILICRSYLLSMGYTHLVYYLLSNSNPLAAMITKNIDYGRKLSNLAKIYTDKANIAARTIALSFSW